VICPAYLILLDLIILINYTWQRVQIMKLLIMQFSPLSRHFIPLRSKYPPQHLVFKHPQSMFLPFCQRSNFTPVHKHRQNYSLAYSSNFYIFQQHTRRQKVLHRMVASITRIQSPLDFLPSSLNIWTVTHFQMICLLFLCPDFYLHSGDKKTTYT
jgi:hypothetical protein